MSGQTATGASGWSSRSLTSGTKQVGIRADLAKVLERDPEGERGRVFGVPVVGVAPNDTHRKLQARVAQA